MKAGTRTKAAPAPQQQSAIIEMEPLEIRAEIAGFDEDERTIDLVFSTGAAVERMDWYGGGKYIEKLSMEPAHVRLARLNAGAPLLDSHSAWSVSDQLGAVVQGSAAVEKGRGTAKVRFSARESVAEILQDVRDKIITSVSVGYRVHKFEEDKGNGNKLPIRTAIDWEPYEISMVSMPADIGAKVRREGITTNQCVLISRMEPGMSRTASAGTATASNAGGTGAGGAGGSSTGGFVPMSTSGAGAAGAGGGGTGTAGGGGTGAGEGTIDERSGALGTGGTIERTEPEPTDADRAMQAERRRCQFILNACRAARMPSDMYDRLVAEGASEAQASEQIFAEMNRRGDPRPGIPAAGARRVEMGEDPFIHKRAGIENALLHRINPTHFQLGEIGREYRGMSILDIARVFLHGMNVRTTDLTKMEVAGMALGLVQHRTGGMHSTSDFPLLLADVANKSLRADYAAAPQTFSVITRLGSVPDFKAANRIAIGDAPSLTPVNEEGEFKRGTIGEAREQIQAATYGRVFAITRKALINDDLQAFSRVPSKFGRMAKNLESDLVWYQILKNANMADGNALFSAAHSNYIGAGDIALTAMTAAARAMRLQKGIDGTTSISAPPQNLIVPPNKEIQALQFVSTSLQAATIANVNPFAGRLSVVTEPRLETGVTIGDLSATGSAFAWYLASDPNIVDIIELAFLEGQNGPVIESRTGFDVDGLEIKCRHDVGAKVLDWRGLFKSDGTDKS